MLLNIRTRCQRPLEQLSPQPRSLTSSWHWLPRASELSHAAGTPRSEVKCLSEQFHPNFLRPTNNPPAMAPLYNRYVPPKPSAPVAAAPAPSAPAPASPDADKKRKRERSEEQKAERKAKKLRNKDVEEEEDAAAASAIVAVTEAPVVEPVVPNEIKPNPKSEFAHVTNIKKRHKLEKEARKARKEADKTGVNVGEVQAVSAEADAVAALASSAKDNAVTPVSGGKANEEEVQDATAGETTRRKKRRKDTEAEQTAGAIEEVNGSESILPDQDGMILDVTNGDAAATEPAKRRHKLEDVLQQAKKPSRKAKGESEDDHLKNYTGVMDKFQKARQLAEQKEAEKPQEEKAEPEPEVQKRDLAPFPQPVNEPKEFKPTFSALPSWLTKPTTISSEARVSFAEMDLSGSTVKHLADLSFREALPVQQALIPLLLQPGTKGSKFLPGTDNVLPDVAVSAATGSGKTIAYLLPMIEALKSTPSQEMLRGLVVVPTRELVMQVAAVAESLAKGSSLKVGISSGVGRFKDEQQRLINTGRKYDPAAYAELMQKAHRRDNPPPIDSEGFEAYADELEQWTDRQEQELQDTLHGLEDHVPEYTSAVDLLVCTPGRLLEHLGSTLGFSIASVAWLVLDEADKLLDQQYDGFLQRVDEELSRPRTEVEQDAREKYLRAKGLWDDRFERRVRKVVLSATMTRDISKLTALKLRRPHLVVVQGAEQKHDRSVDATNDTEMLDSETGAFEIPPTLKEYCVPVGDGSEKPLQLLDLLQSRVLASQAPKSTKESQAERASDSDSDSSSSDSDSSDESDSDDSDSSSSSSEDSSEEDSDDSEASSSSDESEVSKTGKAPTASHGQQSGGAASAPTVLIFTASTESASRLSHLLRGLRPDWSAFITTLTKTTHNANHRATKSTDPVITIATDRAGRGLDTLSGRRITHVLQYDVPRALTAYVHRVGRTARAGASGEAWTFYSDREARWFVNEIMRAANVRRSEPVERVRLQAGGEELKDKFAEVLAGMREAVFGGGK